VILPPVPEAGIELPEAFEATTLVSATSAAPLPASGAITKFANATDPSPMGVVFIPKATQVVEPPLTAQVTLLPAPPAEELASTDDTVSTDG
jgi:hypothetical protein